MTISYQYIAGFFDGEGSVYLVKEKAVWRITIVQSELRVLKLIQDFLGYGNIHERKKWKNHLGKKIIYNYYVGQQKQVVDFIEKIMPFSIVKKDKLEEVYLFLKDRKWHKNYKLQDITKQELEEFYDKFSMRLIATRLCVTYNAIYEALKRFNIPIRTQSDAAKKRKRD